MIQSNDAEADGNTCYLCENDKCACVQYSTFEAKWDSLVLVRWL